MMPALPLDDKRKEQINRQLDKIPAEQTLENPGETRMNIPINGNSQKHTKLWL
jgi:hypothetical protein